MLAMLVMAGQSDGEVLVSCGFESATDTWSFTHTGGGVLNADSGAADFPPGQRILAGSGSWLVTGVTTSTVVFSETLLSGWTDAAITYRVSSTASTGTSGHSGGDQVVSHVAETVADLGSAPKAITLTGWSNAVWGYDSGAPQQVTTAGSAGLSVHPLAGGLRTTDGYTDFKIRIPQGTPSVALKLFVKNGSTKTYWNLDDVALSGTPTTSHDCLWAGDAADTWSNAAAACWIDQSNGNVSSAWDNINGNNAFFSEPGDAVTIAPGTTVAARSLTFASNGCTVVAGDLSSRLALTNGGSGGAGPNTIEVTDPGHTAAVNVPIVGNPGIGVTKTGPGTLLLENNAVLTRDLRVLEGTLCVGSGDVLSGCSTISVGDGATLDIGSVADYRLGAAAAQRLEGAGTIVGNLSIDSFGTHDVGSSPGVQCVLGNYTMDGVLLVEVGGSATGDTPCYDQIVVMGSEASDVSLSGALSLEWYETDWVSEGSQLWIIRNDTAGQLAGAFAGYDNGSVVGDYDGHSWKIYYGAEADTGSLTGGNDVLLMAAAPVPEPSSLFLAAIAYGAILTARLLRRRPASSTE